MIAVDRWLAALSFFLALQIIASIVRYCTRIFIVKRLGVDDLASLITLCISVTFCVLLTLSITTSRGKNDWDLPFDVVIRDSNYALAQVLLYGLGTMSLKVALGLFLLRIFVTRWHRIVIYSVMSISMIYGIFFFFFNLFECGNPLDFAINVISDKCYSNHTVNGVAYTHAALCAISDSIYAVLPIFYLWTANLDRRTKISVGGILTLGCAGCICTLIRIWWIHYLTSPKADFFNTGTGISVMSGAELSIGITCLALTTYKPLFKRGFFPHHNHSSHSSPHAHHPSSHRSRRFPTLSRSSRRKRNTGDKISTEASEGGIVHYTVDVDVYLEGDGDLEAARRRVEMREIGKDGNGGCNGNGNGNANMGTNVVEWDSATSTLRRGPSEEGFESVKMTSGEKLLGAVLVEER